MSKAKLEKLINVVSKKNPSDKDLQKMGLSRADFDNYRRNIMSKKKSYNRIMSDEEKKVITTEAFGYLVKLVNSNTITSHHFENMINISTQFCKITRRKASKKMIDDILDFVVFSGMDKLPNKDAMEFLSMQESVKFEEVN
ncbi:MAG: hypothetical protein HN952_00255 [Candidatus Cloacimonetes bacterium]|nr:hypothetical protein [Candidatus Cloacimonadota bacterium]MBT6993365.1 hypothetical protein [Candidatus Cloacimonadota bacterium]MBT7469102.1 hypothetical protein [Candidatus Cloacimonadota bacterium]